MPLSIESFDENTFVAFLDICGFKDLMSAPGKAEKCLDRFYQSVYEEVIRSRQTPQRVDCIAVSDCAVAFARNNHPQEQQTSAPVDAQRLKSMLVFIKNVARKMVQSDLVIKGSIVYGRLKFENRIETSGIDKAMFVGNAYVDAYRDVEKGSPKLEIGEIRIKPRAKVEDILQQSPRNLEQFSLVRLNKKDYYFYWMLNSIQLRNTFEREFKDRYRRRYEGMISVIRKYTEMPINR